MTSTPRLAIRVGGGCLPKPGFGCGPGVAGSMVGGGRLPLPGFGCGPCFGSWGVAFAGKMGGGDLPGGFGCGAEMAGGPPRRGWG